MIESKITKVALSPKSIILLNKILDENPFLNDLLTNTESADEFKRLLEKHILKDQKDNSNLTDFYDKEHFNREDFETLKWTDFATVRILDYIKYGGKKYEDLNLRGQVVEVDPFQDLWDAFKTRRGGLTVDFIIDMLELFRQYNGTRKKQKVDKEKVLAWMKRFPSGLDDLIIVEQKKNKERIIRTLIDKIDQGKLKSKRFTFDKGLSQTEKVALVNKWWEDHRFHLSFAIRSPELLNEMLGYSLSQETLDILDAAKKKKIPFFVNPYYLSLLLVETPLNAAGADKAIRDYIIYSEQLVDEFNHIVAWEKEDEVEPGKPNAAGWILPTKHNVHRRYPDVAILIPDTVGRACGGLCSSCQRMFDFQNGNLNFDLNKLEPKEKWHDKLPKLMKYFEKDSQLRDILITGGDALMSSPKSMDEILDAIYEMAKNKIEKNKKRADGEKYAQLLRVRLGTRLLAYLPQKINKEMSAVLAKFKEKASRIGVKQFVIQTHFESPLEITPEAKIAIDNLLNAGWIITNQLVFTTAASRRGHTAKLRKVLNDAGILTYYTFTTKGYMENQHPFATNARAVQEQLEEKIIGIINKKHDEKIQKFAEHAENIRKNIDSLRKEDDLPFLATDRNVLNLPAVGKSLTFKVVGITKDGRRVLEFDHDSTRRHSPIIEKMGKVIIIESKSMQFYLDQIEEMGECVDEYTGIFGYSIGATEPRAAIYKYPEFDFDITDKMTNLEI